MLLCEGTGIMVHEHQAGRLEVRMQAAVAAGSVGSWRLGRTKKICHHIIQ